MLSRIRSLWRNLVHRGAVDRELDEELATLQAELIDEKIRAGMSPDAARRAATIELGHVHIVKQHVRDARAGAFWDAFVQDARYGARQLRRNPLFTATAMLSLAIGVGANTTIFSLLNALMLRDLRVGNPHELVEFWRTTPNGPGTSFSNPMYETLRDESPVFSGVLAMSKSTVSAAVDGPERAPAGRYVSGNFFTVLGTVPQMGRLLSAGDDRPGAPDAVAVISHGLWERRFGRSPTVLGEAIRVDAVAFSIVGVLPPTFDDPLVGRPADFFIPIASEARLQPASRLRNAASSWLGIVGRLKPGASLDEASVTVPPIFTRFMEELALSNPDPHGRRRIRSQRLFFESARTGLSDLRRDFSRPVLLLMGAVSLVLLIACVNVVNLLLARGVARRREIALRLAIGASRGRLIRQLLTESTLLGVMGGGLGLAIAAVGAPLLVALVPQGSSPIVLDVTPDTRITFFTLAVAVLSSVIAGLFPAFRSARTDITPSFQGDTRSAATTRSSARWGRSLIAAQVGLSLLLLVGALLLLSTLRNLRAVDPGFDHEHVLLLTLDSAKAGFTQPRLSAYHRQVLDRVRSTPGVRGAALSVISPMSGGGIDLPLGVGGPPSETAPMVYVNRVSDGYFSTLATPVLVGREFIPQDFDAGAATAVVNEALARQYFGGESPVGRRIHMGRGGALEIVGVVADSKYYSLRETGKPTVYLFSIASSEPIGLTLSVRTAGGPLTVSDAIRRDVQSITAAVPVTRARTLASQVERSFGTERLVARLITAFAVLALVLASVGLYGVLGYSVARRTSEIGLRLALGATRAAVLRSVLRESWMLVAIGSAIGVPAAIVLSSVLAALLYGVSPWDARLLGGAVASVLAAATAAATVPAWRASRVEPLVALRHE
jgi:predicted permease